MVNSSRTRANPRSSSRNEVLLSVTEIPFDCKPDLRHTPYSGESKYWDLALHSTTDSKSVIAALHTQFTGLGSLHRYRFELFYPVFARLRLSCPFKFLRILRVDEAHTGNEFLSDRVSMNETNRLMASVQAAKLSILAYPAFRFLHQKLHDAFVFDQVTEEGGTNVEIPGDMVRCCLVRNEAGDLRDSPFLSVADALDVGLKRSLSQRS
ncbi:hypothetical protein BKA93DRAFT_610550 [Sparassis latifolia]